MQASPRPRARTRARTAPSTLLVTLALAALLAACAEQAATTIATSTTSAPSTTSTPGASASPAADPSDEASPDEEVDDAAVSADVTDLATAAVTTEGLPAPEAGFAWAEQRATTDPRASAELFDPCGATSYPTDEERTEVRVVDLRVEEPSGAAPETATVRQNIARYPSTAVAERAVADFQAMARECATSPESGTTTEIVEEADGRLLLQTTPEIGLYTSYTVIARRGDVVTVVAFAPGEVRDADDEAVEVAESVTAALDAAT